jgi:phosphatidylethanolamine-binding protein (PEBP) family uncharacterized protein
VAIACEAECLLWGHERTLERGPGMSASPPKADIFRVRINVCKVPKRSSALKQNALKESQARQMEELALFQCAA